MPDHLRSACCAPNEGMSLTRLDRFLGFLAERLSAPDYAEAESLLGAAVSPILAARRNREAAQ